MNIQEGIKSRRSVRNYDERVIPESTLTELITLGTKAPNGSAKEPWGFVMIQDKAEIDSWSEKIKTYLLENFDQYPYLHQYEGWLKNPKFSVFNHANTVLIIYGNTDSHWYRYDCSLAVSSA